MWTGDLPQATGNALYEGHQDAITFLCQEAMNSMTTLWSDTRSFLRPFNFYTSFAKARRVYKLISATNYKNHLAAENLADFVQEEAIVLLWGWCWAVCEAALLGLSLGTSKIAGDNFLMLR